MISIPEYEKIKVKEVRGRYVTSEHVFVFLSKLPSTFRIEILEKSVLGKPIKSIEIGNGPNRILMWSQMHGNESTTTKAVLDFLNYLAKDGDLAREIIENCTLRIMPILSPDGAEAYTRANANQVDLNRDAQDLSQPESVVLRAVFNSFKPNFAFNLHDQRTIYNVGETDRPSTISFLSPSVDETRILTSSRTKSMELIVAMNRMLQAIIPGSVGRYDDSFNSNCVGDTFQSLNCPTILFEAGHFPDDHQREEVRRLIFLSLLTALKTIVKDPVLDFAVEEYFEIPENGKLFFDILIKNIHGYDQRHKEGDSVGILFEEVLIDGKIEFVPKIEKTGALDSYFGHKTYNCNIEKELLELRDQTRICSVINNI